MAGIEGIVPILLTPFKDDGSIDHDSLRREVDSVLREGVHGIGIAIGSEIFKLTWPERREMLSAVAKHVGGEIPLVMNTSAPGTDVAVALAREAADAGATRLMIWPPDFFPAGPDAVVEHLAHIADAAGLPVILQDVPQAPISPALALRIAEKVPLVDTIKVETQPTVGQVAAMVRAIEGKLTVLGGAGGGTIVEEFRRGARGTMPFASQAGEFMQVWNALRAGNFEHAQSVVETHILPVSRFGFQSGDLFYHVHKALLRENGVFGAGHVRSPTTRLDATTAEEMSRLLNRVKNQHSKKETP